MSTIGQQMSNEITPPQIIKHPDERMKMLVERTKNVTVKDSFPIKRYFSSGKELLRMANTYLDERDMENAFLLYMRYITLFVEKLPNHCQYKDVDESDKKQVRSKVQQLFLLAEEIKTRIKTKYKKEYEDYLLKKQAYEKKIGEANELLAEQKRKDQAEKQDEMRQHFVAELQSKIDKKVLELTKEKINEVNLSKIEKKETVQNEEDRSLRSNILAENSSHPKKPFFDRSTKPSISLLDDFGKENRQLIVPFKVLTEKFIKIAQNNTDRNIETCGILCGQLKRNRFTISHILVPKQTGTSDSCTSINEEELACEQEKYNLITMGWIHTHPTQRSFLSSIDLHTHALYQKMLPEAIAIVVAPSTKEICMYSLTEHGLEYILKCNQSGFHPHTNEQSLYQESEHVLIDDNLSIDVIDLR